LNVRTALLGIFVALTIAFASTTVYESGMRTTLTSTSTSTSTSTVTATSLSTIITTTPVKNTTEALREAYFFHIFEIASEDATALAAQYETNATLLYDYAPLPLHGSINGSANIPRFYEGEDCTCFVFKIPPAVANQTYSITMSNDGKVGNVTSHLIFYGNDPQCPAGGIFSCPSGVAYYYVMGFDISFILQGDYWLISTENVTINSGLCVPVSLSAAGSVLTCPTYQAPS
jgi:hypothetical protein